MRVENDLRPYQKAIAKNMYHFFFENKGRKCCAILPTGTGKSYLILWLLEQLKDRAKSALILEPRRDIAKQIKGDMSKYGLDNADFMTYHKLSQMTHGDIANLEYDVIISDEIHRIGAPTFGQAYGVLVDTHMNSPIFGTTATPTRYADKRDIAEEYFDNNKICEIYLAEALVREIIPVAPLYISALYTMDYEVSDMMRRIDSSKNENKEELKYRLMDKRNHFEAANGVSKIIARHLPNQNAKYVVFCSNIDVLYDKKCDVKQWFIEAGHKAENIHSYEYHSKSRKSEYKAFKNAKTEGIHLLFVVDKLNEGIHLGDINGCILLRSTVSNIVYYQQIGRVIDASRADRTIILDLVNNYNNLRGYNLKEELEKAIQRRESGDFEDCSREFDKDKYVIFDYVHDSKDVFASISQELINSRWDDQELKILHQYYKSEGKNICCRLPNRTWGSIQNKAREEGLMRYQVTRTTNSFAHWTNEEDELLHSLYKKHGSKAYNMLQGRSNAACCKRAEKLGIATKCKRWTKREKEKLAELYEVHGSAAYSMIKGRSVGACRDKIKQMGLLHPNWRFGRYVSYDSDRKQYTVRLKVNGKQSYFGRYKTKEKAMEVAKQKALEFGKPWYDAAAM